MARGAGSLAYSGTKGTIGLGLRAAGEFFGALFTVLGWLLRAAIAVTGFVTRLVIRILQLLIVVPFIIVRTAWRFANWFIQVFEPLFYWPLS